MRQLMFGFVQLLFWPIMWKKLLTVIPLTFLAVFPAIAAVTDEKKPNVLLIITDDQGYGDLGVHGNQQVQTPNLDRLAAESIRFDRFYVSPLCAPTRASLLTGRYSLRTGAKGVSQGLETMQSKEVTIAEALRDNGYRTGLFGKWHNGEHYPYTPQGQGFQESLGFNLGHWNNYFDTALKHNGKWVKTKGYVADVLTDAAISFIEKNHNHPFFTYLSYNTPHSPFQLPDKYFDRYKSKGLDDYLASVYGMCANLDDNIGRVLDRLDELNLRENTIVIFMTDNGPNGERFNGGMRGVKGSLHEGGSRVPFFVRWPVRFKSPGMVRQIAAHIDVFPTLIELCGLVMPKTFPQDGRSLVPLMDGKSDDWPDRIIFQQHQVPANPDRQTGSLRTQRYRMVNEGRGWELFDMENDPGQTKDIASQRTELVAELTAAYEKWWSEILPDTKASRPPIPVGYKEEPMVELPVPQSRFDRGIKFSGRHPNNAWLTGWTDASATVEWDLEVVQGGKYQVSLLYSVTESDAGSRVQLSAGGSSIETVLRAANPRQIPSPDRVPRTEVYEMEWTESSAGTLSLTRGKTTLSLKAVRKSGNSVMDLKAVRLKFLKSDR